MIHFTSWYNEDGLEIRGPHRDLPQFGGTAYRPDVVSDATGLDCSQDEDMTKQEFKAEVDINTIVRRYNLTGELPQGVRMPEYGDFSGISDYREAVTVVRQANEAFAAMPAEIRERFGHDPAAFVEFCEQPENLEEARRMGLVPAAELRELEERESLPAAAPASGSTSPA